MERLRRIEVLRIPHYLTYLHADLRPYLNSIEGSLPEPSDQALFTMNPVISAGIDRALSLAAQEIDHVWEKRFNEQSRGRSQLLLLGAHQVFFLHVIFPPSLWVR